MQKVVVMAKISKSIWGGHWDVEERVGMTLYHTHYDTLTDAVMYCVANGLCYKID